MVEKVSPRKGRLVIGAPQGRSGKTTVSLGICAALAGRQIAVQPFKKGPDYIDPSWLSEAAGRECRSLDPFFLQEPQMMLAAFLKGARDADICLVEGNHGLYDSSLPEDRSGGEQPGGGSTAAVARLLKAPILLVVNTTRMSRSAAAMIHGYQTFEPGTPVAGVILNNVANPRHEVKLRQAIEQTCRIPVVGAIPRDSRLTIPDRHLGLVPHQEDESLHPAVRACQEAAEKYIDLDAVLEIARSAPDLPFQAWQSGQRPEPVQLPVTIGVLRDRAFSFYYPENFEALQEAGASLVWIDAMKDGHLPPVDCLYIGGGFPEMFLESLEANRSLRLEIRQAVENDLPVYAECGGLMYLSQRIHWEGRTAEMVGALPFEIEMTARPQGHGYVLAETSRPTPFLPTGVQLRGHEFHHSRPVQLDSTDSTAYRLLRGSGIGGGRDGYVHRNVLAAYTHIHAGGSPEWAPGLVARARRYHQAKAA